MVGVHYNSLGEPTLFINAGYAALAEAVQGMTISHALGNVGITKIISDLYVLPYELESKIFDLNPDDKEFNSKFLAILDKNEDVAKAKLNKLNQKTQEEVKLDAIPYYKKEIQALKVAGYQPGKTLTFQDLLFSPDQPYAIAIVDSMIGDSPYSPHKGIVTNKTTGIQTITVRWVQRDSLGQVRRRTTTVEIEPVADTVHLSKPFLDQLAVNWDKDTYGFLEEHVRLLRNEFEDVHYNAIERIGEKYILYRRTFLANPNLTHDVKEKALEIIETIKTKGNKSMDWLVIGEE